MSQGSISDHRGQLKRLKRSLIKWQEDAQEDMNTVLPQDPVTAKTKSITCQGHIDKVKDLHERYEKVLPLLESAVNANENATEDDHAEVEDFYSVSTDTISWMHNCEVRKKLLLEIVSTANIDQSPSQSTSNSMETMFQQFLTTFGDIRAAGGAQQVSAVKLPHLQLHRFDGDAFQWKPFWDIFESTVDQNSNLQPVEKLKYLHSVLQNDAYKLVCGLDLTNENYATAINLLKKQYGNPAVAVERLQARLYQLKPVIDDTPKLRDLYFNLESYLCSLSALGSDTDSSHLVGIILSKIPRNVVTMMERAKGAHVEWTVQMLRQRLFDEITIRESSDRRSAQSIEDRPKTNFRPRITADTLAGSDHQRRFGIDGNKTMPRPVQCAFCEQSHYSNECTMYTTVSERKAKARGRCFICLRSNHSQRDCHSKIPCFYCRAVGKHHQSLCIKQFGNSSGPSRNQESSSAADEDLEYYQSHNNDEYYQSQSHNNENNILADDEQTAMKTAKVRVCNPAARSNSENIRVYFDSGSSRTYITQKLARSLKLKTKKGHTLTVNRFLDRSPCTLETQSATIEVRTLMGTSRMLNVSVIPRITNRVNRVAINKDIRSKIPPGIILADQIPITNQRSEVDMLLGNDYYDDVITGQKIDISPGLRLMASDFGWILSGRVPDHNHLQPAIVDNFLIIGESYTISDDQFLPPMEQLWDLETIGIRDTATCTTDDQAMEIFNDTVKFSDSRYQVAWPYRDNIDQLPTNYCVALKRLRSTFNRLKEDDIRLTKYNAVFEDQLQRGVIEKVDNTDTNHRIHYIPHHAVETPHKTTTKIRIVYDASSKASSEAFSLNECMFRGYVFMENLTALLIRFRLFPIAIVADIEKAYLQVGLQADQRDVTRFLWLKDITKPLNHENIQVFRFCRVNFGMTGSQFLLGATVNHHLKHQSAPVAEKIGKDMYVDNLVSGAANVNEAKNLYSESKSIFNKASMNLREWSTNNSEFRSCIADVDSAEDTKVKVLGILWDIQTDGIHLHQTSVSTVAKNKREVLSSLFKIYDPLGYFVPVTIRGRIFLQEINRLKIRWDDPLPQSYQMKWTNIAEDLNRLADFGIQRYIGSPITSKCTLVCFCDASKLAYATVIYLRIWDKEGQVSSKIMFSKARVNPLKELTIPRLELTAVLIGTRAINFIREKIQISADAILMTDSQIVLHWLKSNKYHGSFVDNRLKEIRKLSKDVKFRFVRSSNNAADMASRGVSVAELTNNWFEGPAWLTAPVEKWPNWQAEIDHSIEEQNMLENHSETDKHEDHGMIINEATTESPFGINPETVSSFDALIRRTAWCIRFISKLRGKTSPKTHVLQREEIREANIMWVKAIQLATYGPFIAKKSQLFKQLGVQRDDEGILRCHGRLANIENRHDAKFPIILPTKHHFTDLVIDKCHRAQFHCGVSQTLSAVRQQYWIPKGRSRVKSVLFRCGICKRHEGGPYALPLMPNLPKCRVTRSEPFSATGLDYFGPLNVKRNDDQRKVWIALFTCLATRAIHLELVYDLSANEFILAMRRFVARRTKPKTIISDNAPQFKVANEAFQWLSRQEENGNTFYEYLSNNQINWSFIPEYAPWMGGMYERMIQTTKRSLKKALGKAILSDVQLNTLLTEVEYIVNSRPLTYVDDDINGSMILTPNHLLSIPLKSQLPDVGEKEDVDDPDFQSGKLSTKEKLFECIKVPTIASINSGIFGTLIIC